jgi:hypothetical protein
LGDSFYSVQIDSTCRGGADRGPAAWRGRALAVVLLAGPAGARDLRPGDGTTHWGVRRLVTLEDLEPRAAGNLRKLLTTAAPTRSKLERDLRRLLRHHGLPQPISNGIVDGHEVDLHWPEHRLIAELDGYAFHAPRASASSRVSTSVTAETGSSA